MNKRKILTLLAALFCAVTSFAQDARQIVERMNATMDKLQPTGLEMAIDARIPIIGTVRSRVWALAGKQKNITLIGKKKQITWSDGQSIWDYDEKSQTVSIRKDKPTAKGENVGLFEDILSGYDLSVKEEQAKVWIITCKKSKSNQETDVPKKMILIVEKGSYKPVSLEAHSSMGITFTMHDIKFGVTDKDVTFDPAECNGATIKDYRQ